MEFCVKLLSLPLWERGLKYMEHLLLHWYTQSLPLWERGLKSNYLARGLSGLIVAPLVGAWIEIQPVP